VLVLDTDHLSLLQQADSPDGSRLRDRLASAASEEVVTTIITFEEQMRGWLAAVSRARQSREVVRAYRRLLQTLLNFRQLRVLQFDDDAALIYERLRRTPVRIGTQDLRIAAIVIAHRGTLLTRNTKDFVLVPDLKIGDWLQ
jgi:tRNA(fMet)-specific endonuclease VapC